MRYSLAKDAPQADGKLLRSILDRTGSLDFRTLDIVVPARSLAECLDWGTFDIDSLTTALGGLQVRLSSICPDAPATDSAEPPAHAGWIRATATALSRAPELESRAGTTAHTLGDAIDHDTILRATAHYAGRIKDGAIDARLLTGAYGWFIVSTILDGLRGEVKSLPPKDAEALLAPFAPLLVLIAQVMEEKDALRRKSREESVELEGAVADAQAEQGAAAASLRMKGAPKDVPHETLVDLARRAVVADGGDGRTGAQPTAPRRGGRRSRR